MAGGRSQRFTREEDSSVAIDGARLEAELLQRLEDQAAALAETKSRLALVENALEAERQTRRELSSELAAERAKAGQLSGLAQRSSEADEKLSELQDELALERKNSEGLTRHLNSAWAELRAVNADANRPRRGLRRRHT